MNRRGQGISINVIVIAAIALLVLVILSVLVLRGGGTITQGTSCEQTGGTCRFDGSTISGDRCEDGETQDLTKACSGSTSDFPQYCCRRI